MKLKDIGNSKKANYIAAFLVLLVFIICILTQIPSMIKDRSIENSKEVQTEGEFVSNSKTDEEKDADEANKKAQAEADAKAKAEATAKAEAEKAAKEAEDKTGYDIGLTYSQLARTPEEYDGKKGTLSGKVIQVLEEDGETDLRIAVGGKSNEIVLVAYDPKISSVRILENDRVTVKGISKGIYTYQSTLGGKISVPLVEAKIIEITNPQTK